MSIIKTMETMGYAEDTVGLVVDGVAVTLASIAHDVGRRPAIEVFLTNDSANVLRFVMNGTPTAAFGHRLLANEALHLRGPEIQTFSMIAEGATVVVHATPYYENPPGRVQ